MSELYNLPDGWEWKKLGDLTTTTSGGTPKRNEKLYWGGNIGWLKSGELNDGYITNVEEYITDEGLTKSSAKLFPKGTLLIAMYGATVGKLGILEIETTTNQAICGILNDKNKFETLFMFYYLKKIREKMIEDSFGGAQPNLSQTYIKDLDIPLPPLEEQKRIVVNLDNLFAKIDKAIALHQKNIDEADIFMASVLNDVFAELEEKYKKRTIGSFSKVGTGATPLKNRNDFYENGNINWITSKATNDDYVYESEQLITEIALNECRLKINPIGTIIVALYGQGKTRGQVSELMIESSTNQALATIIVDENESINTYLKYFLKKSYFDIREKASGGTQPNLNLSIIKNIELSLPPLQIQQKVVAYLDEISNKMEKIKQIQKEKMQSLKALKASILDKAFKGEL